MTPATEEGTMSTTTISDDGTATTITEAPAFPPSSPPFIDEDDDGENEGDDGEENDEANEVDEANEASSWTIK